jgi:6-phosphogluconate dehydrogenase
MQLGMIGLGRMGSNMARRLLKGDHQCVVFNRNPEAALTLAKQGAVAASSLEDLVSKLRPPRAVWLMVPTSAVDGVVGTLVPLLQKGDVVIDGGNSHYADDLRRAAELEKSGVLYLDVGTSGGVWGRERGYCLMIGGPEAAVLKLEPVFRTLAPGLESVPRTAGREKVGGTVEEGYLHCGPAGAGHFVKMVHNGIEYGLMAAYAEGFNVLRHAGIGNQARPADAETAPLQHPERYRYDLNLADIAEVWRRGSVIASWLLDLTALALLKQPGLESFSGRVSDSGEGRWTLAAALDEGCPAPVLGAALFQRFASRGEEDFANRLLSAMRFEFGGHQEKKP